MTMTYDTYQEEDVFTQRSACGVTIGRRGFIQRAVVAAIAPLAGAAGLAVYILEADGRYSMAYKRHICCM
jgi:hypothetical protein